MKCFRELVWKWNVKIIQNSTNRLLRIELKGDSSVCVVKDSILFSVFLKKWCHSSKTNSSNTYHGEFSKLLHGVYLWKSIRNISLWWWVFERLFRSVIQLDQNNKNNHIFASYLYVRRCALLFFVIEATKIISWALFQSKINLLTFVLCTSRTIFRIVWPMCAMHSRFVLLLLLLFIFFPVH